MIFRRVALTLLFFPCLTGHSSAATLYRITATNGAKSHTYEVTFGGTRSDEMLTAFCPQTKKFVYLSWSRKDKAPLPAAHIWDSQTGRTIPLYKFPDSPSPLPIIDSIDNLKVCPFTGDKTFRRKEIFIAD